MKLDVDVCVFGVGPAGTSVAARLDDLGISTIVLDRPAKRKPWGGESLTGAIRGPLTILGLWEKFTATGHVAGYEQRTAWGGDPWVKDSIFASQGNIWHVDRARFDGDLREAAQQRGIPILNYRNLQNLSLEGNEWCIGIEHGLRIHSRYIVDATGRARAVARRLGVRPRAYDRLIGFTALIPRNSSPDFDHAMIIEATPHGWWYAAPVPQGHVLAFFTDADLVLRELPRSMRAVAANSAFAQPEKEEYWLTVGDACAAHDPLCGWGVHRAMSNGIMAAEAICRYIKDADGSLLAEYRKHCCSQFEGYLLGLSKHYSYEQRWSSLPFWERRRGPMSQLT